MVLVRMTEAIGTEADEQRLGVRTRAWRLGSLLLLALVGLPALVFVLGWCVHGIRGALTGSSWLAEHESAVVLRRDGGELGGGYDRKLWMSA
jgi:hypothetical protein